MGATPRKFKILGHTPAAIAGVVEALLAVVLSFGVFHLSQVQVGDIMAVVTAALGLVVAVGTKDSLLSAMVGFAKSALVLAAVFGLPLTAGETAAAITAITVVGGFFLHSSNSAIDTAFTRASRGAYGRAA